MVSSHPEFLSRTPRVSGMHGTWPKKITQSEDLDVALVPFWFRNLICVFLEFFLWLCSSTVSGEPTSCTVLVVKWQIFLGGYCILFAAVCPTLCHRALAQLLDKTTLPQNWKFFHTSAEVHKHTHARMHACTHTQPSSPILEKLEPLDAPECGGSGSADVESCMYERTLSSQITSAEAVPTCSKRLPCPLHPACRLGCTIHIFPM
jgi:hypothetical protein